MVAVDRRALDEFAIEVRRAARLARDPPVQHGEVLVDPAVARWRRLHVSHAVERLPSTAIADAAWGITSRLVNSLTGRVVVDGDIAGSWGRVKGAVTVLPWTDGAAARLDQIEEEARTMARTVDFPFSFRVVTS